MFPPGVSGPMFLSCTLYLSALMRVCVCVCAVVDMSVTPLCVAFQSVLEDFAFMQFIKHQ